MDIMMHAIKEVIFPGTLFFYLISLDLPNLVDELFQRANWYTMLEDNLHATSECMVILTQVGTNTKLV